MEVMLHSTPKIVKLVIDGVSVPARIWEGVTSTGIECHAYITRIAVNENDDTSQFDTELQEHSAPTAAIEAIPLRMIL